jgi:hypothetical protein
MAEVRPLVRINDRKVGAGQPGPISARLHAELRRMMESGDFGEPVPIT